MIPNNQFQGNPYANYDDFFVHINPNETVKMTPDNGINQFLSSVEICEEPELINSKVCAGHNFSKENMNIFVEMTEKIRTLSTGIIYLNNTVYITSSPTFESRENDKKPLIVSENKLFNKKKIVMSHIRHDYLNEYLLQVAHTGDKRLLYTLTKKKTQAKKVYTVQFINKINQKKFVVMEGPSKLSTCSTLLVGKNSLYFISPKLLIKEDSQLDFNIFKFGFYKWKLSTFNQDSQVSTNFEDYKYITPKTNKAVVVRIFKSKYEVEIRILVITFDFQIGSTILYLDQQNKFNKPLFILKVVVDNLVTIKKKTIELKINLTISSSKSHSFLECRTVNVPLTSL